MSNVCRAKARQDTPQAYGPSQVAHRVAELGIIVALVSLALRDSFGRKCLSSYVPYQTSLSGAPFVWESKGSFSSTVKLSRRNDSGSLVRDCDCRYIVAQGRQEVVVGTLDGCVYVLSMEVNPEVVGRESHGRSRDRRNRRRRRDQERGEKGTSGRASAAPDANSDVYSSSSTDRSRRSASPNMDGAVEDHASRWLVGFP